MKKMYRVALVLLFDSETRFLLQHRTADAKVMPNFWAFFGGGCEEGENPIDAAHREAFEELRVILKKPELLLEKDFEENGSTGRLYVFAEPYFEDKSILHLCEGQGWGWYKIEDTRDLKMKDRDRKILSEISSLVTKRTQKCLS